MKELLSWRYNTKNGLVHVLIFDTDVPDVLLFRVCGAADIQFEMSVSILWDIMVRHLTNIDPEVWIGLLRRREEALAAQAKRADWITSKEE